MKKIKEGISLIVLVITIIVMIILAAAIIISLNNTGIIENSNKAVDETNEKTVQEIANLAWGEAYADGVRSVDKLKEAVEKALENNNLNPKDYGINVTENGAYKMLFGSSDENNYWFASLFVDADSISAGFGLRYVKNGVVGGNYLVGSLGDVYGKPYGVCAVVTLSPNVTLEGTAASGYEIK